MATTNAMNRRSVLDSAFDRATKPKSIKVSGPSTNGRMTLHAAGQIALKDKDPSVGGLTKLMFALPPDEQRKVRELVSIYSHQRELGRHGNTQDLLDAFGLPADLAEAVVNGLEADYVAAELQRRRPTDGSATLPDLTRRDHLEAAFEAREQPKPPKRPERPAPKLNTETSERDAHYAKVVDERLNEGETPTEAENQRGRMRNWGWWSKVENTYNQQDRMNNVRQGDTRSQQEAARGALRRWGGDVERWNKE